MTQAPILDVRDLSVALLSSTGNLPIVEDLSFEIGPGEFFALVGESGSGKSVSCLALMGLLASHLQARGHAALCGRALVGDGARPRRARSGAAMIFQHATQSLNPVRSIGFQLMETLRTVRRETRSTAKSSATGLLAEVGLPNPERLLAAYPHQLSGGMNQRVMIALALAVEPTLLIADEPTSSLDVTMQAQILDLLDRLRRDRGMAVLFVTHDLAVAAERADRIGVLYAGRLVELGDTQDVFSKPLHRYTAGLLASMPRFGAPETRLPALAGSVPLPGAWPSGCGFAPRCVAATDSCRAVHPAFRGEPSHRYACHHPVRQLA